jgi:hypothetical protein
MAVTLAGEEWSLYVAALAEWNVGGNPAPVEWAGRAEQDRQDYLPDLTPKQIKEFLYQYARDGGKISRVDEQREPYRHYWKYHYDLWPTINGVVYYFETRLDCEDPEEPVIYVMRFKPDR